MVNENNNMNRIRILGSCSSELQTLPTSLNGSATLTKTDPTVSWLLALCLTLTASQEILEYSVSVVESRIFNNSVFIFITSGPES